MVVGICLYIYVYIYISAYIYKGQWDVSLNAIKSSAFCSSIYAEILHIFFQVTTIPSLGQLDIPCKAALRVRLAVFVYHYIKCKQSAPDMVATYDFLSNGPNHLSVHYCVSYFL